MNKEQKNQQDFRLKKEEKNENSRFLANSKYFTISIYAIGVVFISALIIKLFVSWSDTVKTARSIINMLMPFIIGGLIAFILNPATKKIYHILDKYFHLKSEKLKKIQISSSITDLVNYTPKAVEEITHFVDNLEERFPSLDMEVIRTTINNALPDVVSYIRDFAGNLVPALYQVSMIIVQWLLNLFIAVIVSIYMISDKKPLKNSLRAIVYAFVPVKYITTSIEILKEGYHLFSSFIIGKALDSTIIGCLCFFAMLILRLPYAVLISVIVGITNMIPYFGPFIGAVPGAIILLLISPVQALIFVLLIFVLQQFDGLILGPKILGDSTGLKPLWIIVAITIGGSLGGVLGMFLGVPVVAFLRYLANRILSYRLHKRNLMANEKEPLA